MQLHFDILPPSQRAIWGTFEKANLSQLILFGGTAVALRYGHRQSIDFDFFGGINISPEIIYQRLPWLETHIQEVLQSKPNTFVITATAPGMHSSGTVKLSFFGGISIALVKKPEIAANGLALASPEDLLISKLKVINQRIESKDYIDIAIMLKNSPDPKRMLEQGLADMLAIYPDSAPAETLKALCWFKGGDLQVLSDSYRDFLARTVAKVSHLPPPSINPLRTIQNFDT